MFVLLSIVILFDSHCCENLFIFQLRLRKYPPVKPIWPLYLRLYPLKILPFDNVSVLEYRTKMYSLQLPLRISVLVQYQLDRCVLIQYGTMLLLSKNVTDDVLGGGQNLYAFSDDIHAWVARRVRLSPWQ